jgi:hypothetical protein
MLPRSAQRASQECISAGRVWDRIRPADRLVDPLVQLTRSVLAGLDEAAVVAIERVEEAVAAKWATTCASAVDHLVMIMWMPISS